MNYQDGLKQAEAHLDALAALRAPTSVLLGVNQDVRDALASLGLETVFDRATSPLFALVYEIGESLQGRGPAALARFDSIPGGVAVAGGPSRLEDFANADIAAIRSLTPEQATELKTALQVDTVGDLGRWIPYRSARRVLEAAGGAGEGVTDDAAELVPKFGEFPTERRYYSAIVMDHVEVQNPVDLTTAGPVDISPTLEADFGFSAPAVGARLTFRSRGSRTVSRRQPSASVALAPCESTRIAVVDCRVRRAPPAPKPSRDGSVDSADVAQPRNQRSAGRRCDRGASGFSHNRGTSTTNRRRRTWLQCGPGVVRASGPSGRPTRPPIASRIRRLTEPVGLDEQQVMEATQPGRIIHPHRRASARQGDSETEHEVSPLESCDYNHTCTL